MKKAQMIASTRRIVPMMPKIIPAFAVPSAAAGLCPARIFFSSAEPRYQAIGARMPQQRIPRIPNTRDVVAWLLEVDAGGPDGGGEAGMFIAGSLQKVRGGVDGRHP